MNPTPEPPLVTPTESYGPEQEIACDDYVQVSDNGAANLYKFEVTVGTGIGLYGIDWNMGGYIPDRFQIYWDGVLTADTKFVGGTNQAYVPTGTFTYDVYSGNSYTPPALSFTSLGTTEDMTITPSDITTVGTTGTLSFNKTSPFPATIEVWVWSHPTYEGTVWSVTPNCDPNEYELVGLVECCLDEGGGQDTVIYDLNLTGTPQELFVNQSIAINNVPWRIATLNNGAGSSSGTIDVGDSDIYDNCDEAVISLGTLCYSSFYYSGCNTSNIYIATGSHSYGVTGTTYLIPDAEQYGDKCAVCVQDQPSFDQIVVINSTKEVVDNCESQKCILPTPTQTITPTSEVTPTAEVTPTSEVTPTAEVTPTITPTPQISLYRQVASCCDWEVTAFFNSYSNLSVGTVIIDNDGFCWNITNLTLEAGYDSEYPTYLTFANDCQDSNCNDCNITASQFIPCEDLLNDTDVFALYDASGSYTESELQEVSTSIRSWFSNLVNNSGYTGNLYEVAISGERWLGWANYPYLGSLTGGTYPNGVTYTNNGASVYDSNTTAKLINRGLTFDGLSASTISSGVPFNHNDLGTNIYGDFSGLNINSLIIITENEAANDYHDTIGNNTWSSSEPTSDFEIDTDGYLNTWNIVKNTSGGSINVVVLPNPAGQSSAQYYHYNLHVVGAVEGVNRTESYMISKYGDSYPYLNSDFTNPLMRDFSVIETSNPYSAMTTWTGYTNLPSEYKYGAGLTNYNVSVNPSLNSFNSTVIAENVNNLFAEANFNNSYFATTGTSFSVGDTIMVEGQQGTCYQKIGNIEVNQISNTVNTLTSNDYAEFTNCNDCSFGCRRNVQVTASSIIGGNPTLSYTACTTDESTASITFTSINQTQTLIYCVNIQDILDNLDSRLYISNVGSCCCTSDISLVNTNASSPTINYTKCDGTTSSISVPAAGMGGQPGQATITDCIVRNSLSLISGVTASPGTCCT
jgi:hypothetical protein